jgi:hypothetical protein
LRDVALQSVQSLPDRANLRQRGALLAHGYGRGRWRRHWHGGRWRHRRLDRHQLHGGGVR